MVDIISLAYRILMFLFFVATTSFIVIKLPKAPKEFKKYMEMSLLLFGIITIGRLIDIIALFHEIPYYTEIHMITHGGGAGGLVVLYIIFLHLLEKFSFPEVSFDIKRGKAYLVKNFEEIKGIIDAIHPSSILAIAREIEKYKDITTHIVWVTNVPEKGVNPTALHVLLDLSIRFANEHENALIILDCLEFLVLYNGFELTFKFLLSLKDNLLIRGATLIIVVKPETFNEQQLTLLKREFQTL